MEHLTRKKTYYPKKSRLLLLLAVCLLFTIGGIWMIKDEPFGGYLCAIFFGTGCAASIIQLLPGSAYLKIKDEGIEFCSLFRKTTILWDDISEFCVYSVSHRGMTVNKMVGINFVPEYDRSKLSRKLSTALAGCEGGLPDTYGFKAEELASLLNEYLLEYRQQSMGQPLEEMD
ncbi:MAG: hypothetical protein JW860_04710 [Sedimentisphaerales bacterium]|nr:hypothetical protein [Sedimentisphaerales bacterium]